MGTVLRCKKTSQSIDLGANGMSAFRQRISKLCGEPWTSHYAELLTADLESRPQDWYNEFDKKTAELIQKRKISIKIVDFLLQSDQEGAIRFGACKMLLKTIGNYNDDLVYGYAGVHHPTGFSDIRRLLEQCVKHRCDLTWD